MKKFELETNVIFNSTSERVVSDNLKFRKIQGPLGSKSTPPEYKQECIITEKMEGFNLGINVSIDENKRNIVTVFSRKGIILKTIDQVVCNNIAPLEYLISNGELKQIVTYIKTKLNSSTGITSVTVYGEMIGYSMINNKKHYAVSKGLYDCDITIYLFNYSDNLHPIPHLILEDREELKSHGINVVSILYRGPFDMKKTSELRKETISEPRYFPECTHVVDKKTNKGIEGTISYINENGVWIPVMKEKAYYGRPPRNNNKSSSQKQKKKKSRGNFKDIVQHSGKTLNELVREKCRRAIENESIDHKLIGKIVNPFNGYSDVPRSLGKTIKECILEFNSEDSRDDFLDNIVSNISKIISCN